MVSPRPWPITSLMPESTRPGAVSVAETWPFRQTGLSQAPWTSWRALRVNQPFYASMGNTGQVRSITLTPTPPTILTVRRTGLSTFNKAWRPYCPASWSPPASPCLMVLAGGDWDTYLKMLTDFDQELQKKGGEIIMYVYNK